MQTRRAKLARAEQIIVEARPDLAGRVVWADLTYLCRALTSEGAAERYLATHPAERYISDVFTVGGREYYRNKRGRCEDAPCCGCCTI